MSDDQELLVGVATRRDLLNPEHGPEMTIGAVVTRTPVVVFDDDTLRDAADHMVRECVGRLPVVTRENPRKVIGMLSRSELLAAHASRLRAATAVVTPRWVNRTVSP